LKLQDRFNQHIPKLPKFFLNTSAKKMPKHHQRFSNVTQQFGYISYKIRTLQTVRTANKFPFFEEQEVHSIYQHYKLLTSKLSNLFMLPERIRLIANFTLVDVYPMLTIFHLCSSLCSLPPHQPISMFHSSTN